MNIPQEPRPIHICRIIVHTVVLTVVWVLFALYSHTFMDESPPRANIVPSEMMDIHGEKVEVPIPDEKAIRNGDWSLPFMTEEAFQGKMQEYKRAHTLHGILAVLFGLATFVVGMKLFEHWSYGLACVLFGPLVVAYPGYRRSRLT